MQKTLNRLKLPYLNKLSSNSYYFSLGVISTLGFAPYKILPLTLVAYAGLYICNNKNTFRQSFCFFIGQALFGCAWLYNSISNYGHLGQGVSFVLTIIAAVLIALIPSGTSWMARNYRVIAWPLWITISEIIRSYFLFSGFPWLLLSYSQIHSPWYKLITIFGVHGTSFIVAFIIACWCEWLQQKRGIFLVAISAWILSCFITTQKNKPMRTIKFASHKPETFFEISADNLTHGDNKVAFNIWPEGVIHHILNEKDKTALKKVKVLTIFGGITEENGKIFNSTIAAYPNGKITSHEKYNLVAFGEYWPMRKLFEKVYKIPFFDMSPAEAKNKKLIQLDSRTYILPIMCYDIGFSNWMKPEIKKAAFLVSLHQMRWFASKKALAQQIELAQARSIESQKSQIFVEQSIGHIVISPDGSIQKSSHILVF